MDFQTSHFADFEQFKNIYFVNFGHVRIDLFFPFYCFGQVTVILLVRVRHVTKKNPIKIQELGTNYFQ